MKFRITCASGFELVCDSWEECARWTLAFLVDGELFVGVEVVR